MVEKDLHSAREARSRRLVRKKGGIRIPSFDSDHHREALGKVVKDAEFIREAAARLIIKIASGDEVAARVNRILLARRASVTETCSKAFGANAPNAIANTGGTSCWPM